MSGNNKSPKTMAFDPMKAELAPNTVLVEKLPKDLMTKGGLHLPENVAEEQFIGRVLKCNGDREYKRGGYVLFRQGSGVDIQVQDRDDLVALNWKGDLADEVVLYWPPGSVDV